MIRVADHYGEEPATVLDLRYATLGDLGQFGAAPRFEPLEQPPVVVEVRRGVAVGAGERHRSLPGTGTSPDAVR